MIIVGGSYRETCSNPDIDRVFGSGGRAAAAIGTLSPDTRLHTYAYRGWAQGVRSTMAAFGVGVHVTEIEEELRFRYFYPLQLEQAPSIPGNGGGLGPLEASGEVALAFGMLEGAPVITARRAVFDPQASVFDAEGAVEPAARLGGGSAIQELAYVVADHDLGPPEGDGHVQAVAMLRQECGAQVVVVRDRVGGAEVHIGDARPIRVPAYLARTWSRIGVGDVFCAAFARFWGEVGLGEAAAADLAARAVAHFADGHRLPLPDAAGLSLVSDARAGLPAGPVMLVGPCATLAQRWLLDEAYMQLAKLLHGHENPIFSPAHGDRPPHGDVAAVLAFVDGADVATNVEVGRARSARVPVVVLAEGTAPRDLTMFEGDGCEVTHDLATAIYRVFMAARRPAAP